MIEQLTSAFRVGTDDPVRALERVLEAADRARNDKAILWRAPTAHEEAEASRARYRDGTSRGPIDGISLVVKDCVNVAGLPTTNGTTFLTDPVTTDALIVQRLRAAGAVVFAKTNMHEFGIQPTGINPHYGTPVNPWDPNRIPGGSSSGSSVAVAAGIVPVAVGTDAGGSVRIPAAINGLVGLKPTLDAIPLEGVSSLTFDLDHVGAIARTVEDATLLFEVLADRRVDRDVTIRAPAVLRDLFEGAERGVANAVSQAAREVFSNPPEVASPFCEWAVPVQFVIAATDVQKTFGRYIKDHIHAMALDTRIILRLGAGMRSDDRTRADRIREAMRRELDSLLQNHDVLISPAIGSLPPRIGTAARKHGELDIATMARLGAPSFVTNLTGHPSVVVSCVSEGLPIAMQLIGRYNEESRILAAARIVENRFPTRRPPTWYS